MTQLAHISFVPKEYRAQLRKMGRTLHICKFCNMKAYRGEPRPHHDENGYRHNWQEMYICTSGIHPLLAPFNPRIELKAEAQP